jgi:hypothetical protein
MITSARISPRKTHTISLRLSEKEFEALQLLRSEGGLGSVSEFVRETMNRAISEKVHSRRTLEIVVQEIDGKVQVLAGEVARLSRLFGQHAEGS